MENALEFVTEILNAVNSFFRTKQTVETSYGPQSTSAGFVLNSLENLNHPKLCFISVSMKDRAVREKDLIRNGDMVYLEYDRATKEVSICGE